MAGRVLPEDPGAGGFEIQTTTRKLAFDTVGDLRDYLDLLVNLPSDAPEAVQALVPIARDSVADLDRGVSFERVRRRLFERLNTLPPVAPTPDEQLEPEMCVCGAVLLEPGWSGRLKVLCESCGTTWGAEARDDGSYSIWTIDRPEPTTWRSVSKLDPEEGRRFKAVFLDTVVALGGRVDELQSAVHIDRSLDGMPREIRITHPFGDAIIMLHEGANIELWIKGVALDEVQRQRDPEPRTDLVPEDPGAHEQLDDEVDAFGYFDPDRFDYAPIDERNPEIAQRAINRYVEILMSFAAIPETREADVRASVKLDASVNSPTRILRFTSGVSGGMFWQDGEESPDELIGFVEQRAYEDAEWLDTERRLVGSNGWED